MEGQIVESIVDHDAESMENIRLLQGRLSELRYRVARKMASNEQIEEFARLIGLAPGLHIHPDLIDDCKLVAIEMNQEYGHFFMLAEPQPACEG